jgi:hypothetical protein
MTACEFNFKYEYQGTNRVLIAPEKLVVYDAMKIETNSIDALAF